MESPLEQTADAFIKIAKKQVDRRRFLGLVFAGLAAASLPGSEPQKPPDPSPKPPKQDTAPSKELEPIPSNTVIIDFAPEKPVEGLDYSGSSNNDKLLQSLLGEDYISRERLITEFGEDFDKYTKLEKEVFGKYPKVALVYGALGYFTDHGESVAAAMQAIWKDKGYKSHASLIPLQNIIAAGPSDFRTDQAGNRGFFLNVEPGPVIHALQNRPEQKIVNFSFQMGEFGFTYLEKQEETDWEALGPLPIPAIEKDAEGEKSYFLYQGKINYAVHGAGGKVRLISDGNEVPPITREEFEKTITQIGQKAPKIIKNRDYPTIDVKGAYVEDRAEQNLHKLFQVCRSFPDKLFITAAGNFHDDLRQARKTLANDWPPNLLLTAEWSGGSNQPLDSVQGADIYIDNRALGLPWGSSHSTPAISALSSVLINKGLSIDEVKATLLSYCDRKRYESSGSNEEISLLNPTRAGIPGQELQGR